VANNISNQRDPASKPDHDSGASVAPGSVPPTRNSSSTSLRDLWRLVVRRRGLVFGVECGLLAACLIYCLIAPNQYEATGRVQLRSGQASAVSLDGSESPAAAQLSTTPLGLETAAGVLRSDQLAWRVIAGLKLYRESGFKGSFDAKFKDFRPEAPAPDAQAWLLERFQRRLDVQSIPRTLIIEIRFRCRDAALSASVVNALIQAYEQRDLETELNATAAASGWLNGQLKELKARADGDDERVADFEAQHGMVSAPATMANGAAGQAEHSSAALEMDELGRQLVAATTDRILAEAELRAARDGDPELVMASSPDLKAQGEAGSVLLQQIHAKRSDLEQERAQLSAEHGPNFPRVVEIDREIGDLDRQKQAEDAKLVGRFQSNWQTALNREKMVRASLEEATGEGLKLNEAANEYAAMRQEANASHELYVKVLEKVEEAGLAAGVHSSNIEIVDSARQPVKPVAPDLPLYLAITFFAGLWVALGGALMAENFGGRQLGAVAAMIVLAIGGQAVTRAQPPPSPNTSGLPEGTVRIPQSQETKSHPNPMEAPAVWNQPGAPTAGAGGPQAGVQMPGLIGPGDWLDVSEFHDAQFHSQVRVAATGAVTLPMIGEIQLAGLDEPAAARAIEAALVAKGMLLHPLVSVHVTAFAAQDVSVLGEVTHPGVYPYTFHHRLLDVVAEASGLTPGAGRVVNVFHRDDPKTAHPVVLDPTGADPAGDHNPELSPGDTVQVSRAGLVYVVGDLVRPGGFTIDPAQEITVVQAISLAWGPSQNAALTKAILIREQKDGRTITALNLKRMLRGLDPDLPIHDRDIIFVPDSLAKNLANRTMESAIQSTIGVSIYSGLVYSQRY
jgi:polysaccharide export outer membrane protein